MTAVVAFAFQNKRQLQSVVLNEGLERLEPRCFEESQIRRLVLPSSVTDVGFSAFAHCESLRSADLRAARGLKKLRDGVFGYCKKLGEVRLGNDIKVIGDNCFRESALEEVVIPRRTKLI